MLLGNFPEAQTLFLEAENLLHRLPPERKPDEARRASLWACLSYCYSRNRDHGLAVFFGEKANVAGFHSAALLNNIGYSCLRKADPEKAKHYLTLALRDDPNLVPAVRNHVLLVLTDCLTQCLDGKEVNVPGWVLDQLDRVIPQRMAQGATEPSLQYKVAAQLFSFRGDRERVRTYLSRACLLGIDLEELKNDRVLGRDPENTVWLNSAERTKIWRPAVGSMLDLCLVDPLSSALP